LEKELDRFEGYSGRKLFLDKDWDVISGEDSSDLPCLTTVENLLNVVYTSSTTGKPKGTLISIDSILNRIFWMWEVYPFRSDDVAVLQKSYALVASAWECFGGLLAGIPTLILSHWDVLDRNTLWKKLTENNVSYLLASPTLLEGIIEQGKANPNQWRTLRLATSGAELMTPSMALQWRDAFPRIPLYNLYGSTECSSNVTAYDTQPVTSESARVPIGKPLPNIQVFVLDRRLRPVPVGAVGELCVSGVCLARGYANLPLLTANQFIPNPYSKLSGVRLFKTGDLARYRSDGALEVIGRQDHQVKLRGFRIDLADIESALSQHDQVKHCAVSVFEEDSKHKQLVAYIVIDGSFSATGMRQFLQARLPDYMVPSAFVKLTALPRTPNGKIDRRMLPTPDASRIGLGNAFVKPRSPTECQLAQIWEDILQIHPVGITDNFFELGGNSLEAMRVLARVQSQLDRELPLLVLFQAATIQELASILDGEEFGPSPSLLVHFQTCGTKPPFFCVHGAGGDVLRFVDLVKHWDVDQPFYGLQRHGIDEPDTGYISIQDMASEYIQAIRTVQKEGPYVVGGWSMGGLVACEMARQLQMHGQKTALLILLDTPLPDRDYLSSRVTPKESSASRFLFSWEEISVAVEHLLQHEPTVLSMNRLEDGPRKKRPSRQMDKSGSTLGSVHTPSGFQELFMSEACVEISSPEVRDFVMAKAETLNHDLDEEELVRLHRYVQIYLRNIHAKRHYRLFPYQGEIAFFSAAEGINRTRSDFQRDWEGILEQSIRIYEVPGDHYSMFREPNVRELAKRILSCLQVI
jgi:amino acid adenylation domain-containing protein